MKKTIGILILLYLPSAFSQTYYPLEIGNRWDYGILSASGNSEHQYSVYITGDTLMPNGKHYFIERLSDSARNYLRQESNRIYQFIRPDTELLLYDFSHRFGDTILIRYEPGDTLITTAINGHPYIFDVPRWTWAFHTWSTHTSFYRNVKVTDSIGCIQVDVEGEASYYLLGAIINGKQYGIITSVWNTTLSLPEAYSLYQNYPNPFNPTTTIGYDVPKRSHVTMRVFDMLGQEVRTLVNEEKSPGGYNLKFDAGALPSGVYFYKLNTGGFSEQKKMVIIR